MNIRILICFLLISATVACVKKPEGTTQIEDGSQLPELIIKHTAAQVIAANYSNLAACTVELLNAIEQLATQTTDSQLALCRDKWRLARSAWEQSEAFLFGPVATEDIDPRIDTWPVNFTDLELLLASAPDFTPEYVQALDDALKGFHPIEYLLFGENGNKSAAQFDAVELDYLQSLALHLNELTTALDQWWSLGNSQGFHHQFAEAGSGSILYATRRDALEELVNAMAGICDEVANGKMNEPFVLLDASLEESPFSQNSIKDFSDNILGVENVYLGRYTADGYGLEDLVKYYNLSLDQQIKQRLAAARASLNNITVPFGEALFAQPQQVQQAIDKINALAEVLENDLMLLVQQHVQ